MEYAYAALLLSESGEELNERNLRAVLEAANCAVSESRVKALVAALEDVEVDDVAPGKIGRVDATNPSEGGGEHRSDETPEGVTGEPASRDPSTGEGGDESG